jgi:hypothetical protein
MENNTVALNITSYTGSLGGSSSLTRPIPRERALAVIPEISKKVMLYLYYRFAGYLTNTIISFTGLCIVAIFGIVWTAAHLASLFFRNPTLYDIGRIFGGFLVICLAVSMFLDLRERI